MADVTNIETADYMAQARIEERRIRTLEVLPYEHVDDRRTKEALWIVRDMWDLWRFAELPQARPSSHYSRCRLVERRWGPLM